MGGTERCPGPTVRDTYVFQGRSNYHSDPLLRVKVTGVLSSLLRLQWTTAQEVPLMCTGGLKNPGPLLGLPCD